MGEVGFAFTTQELTDLFTRWQDSWRRSELSARTPEKFIRDGPVYPEEYSDPARVPRILFILKDTNGFISPETPQPADMAAAIREHGTGGWVWVVRWAAAVLGLPEDKRDNAWKHVAMMNLKKEDGTHTVPGEVVNWHAFVDRKYLREEFALLDPQIVFFCGTDDAALWLLELNAMPLPEESAEKTTWFRQDGRTFISIWHPKYRKQQQLKYAEKKLAEHRLEIWPGR